MPTTNTAGTEDEPDAAAVASLLVPAETPQTTVMDLIEALKQAGFTSSHRDGFNARNTVAYDIRAPDHDE